MTEVMVHSLLGGSFSFTGSKFNHIQPSNASEMSIAESNETEESTLNFSEKMDSTCDKSSESTICESDSDDYIITNSHVTEENVSETVDVQDSANNIVKSNISNKEYEIVSTKTTVINTTYNLISQSSSREMDMTTSLEHSSWSTSPYMMSEDKSRVIVQIIKSDAKDYVKPQNVVDNKSTNVESQSVHSFRDDVFKLLAKSRPMNFDDGDNSQEKIPIKDTLNICNTFQSISSEYQDTRTQIMRSRRKRNLKAFFLNGRGAKISDLKCVRSNIRQASPTSLRNLHYIMFNTYGLCSTGLQLLKTKRNIYCFCGYPFKRSSEEYRRKVNCLFKLPLPMLADVHKAIFGKSSVYDRSKMVNQLMEFLLKPKKCSAIMEGYENKIKQIMSTDEYTTLKESALKGPSPTVVLQKLSVDDIRRLMNDDEFEKSKILEKCESAVDNDEIVDDSSSYTVPAYILNGPGAKFKCFPKIARNVYNARDKHIKILHYVLYGRIESANACRRNILEFNGFSKCQQDFAAERRDILKRLDQRELFHLCNILCLHARTNSRKLRIKKIFNYLLTPSEPVIHKRIIKHKDSSIVSSESNIEIRKPNRKMLPSTPSSNASGETENGDWELRNFRSICSNVECAPPSDLTELNDILFLKPCDESDIHQKILDFSSFDFPVNSIDHECRKTLMHYMGFCIIHKIAQLLDIENCDKITSQEDLSASILQFLMRKKSSDSSLSKSSSLSLSKSTLPSLSKSTLPSLSESLSPSLSKSLLPSLSKSISPSFSTSEIDSFLEKPESQRKHFKSEVFQHHPNQAFTHQKDMLIQRLLHSPAQTESMCQSSANLCVQMDVKEIYESDLPCANSAEDDSILLRDLIHHPSEEELKEVIRSLVKENIWCFTLGDLVERVYQLYPKVNLGYQESFIKAEARQMISQLRDYAVGTVKYNGYRNFY